MVINFNKYVQIFKEMLNKYMKGGKLDFNKILILVVIAIMLIGIGNHFTKEKKQENTRISADSTEMTETFKRVSTDEDYVLKLENRIEDFIRNFVGVEDAKVMLSLENGKEYILAKEEKRNVNSTTEKDIKGGERILSVEDISDKIFIQNGNVPFIIKEKEPTVCGIVILIAGKLDISLIANVKEAMKAYLNIPINKVQVYQMEGKK